MRALVVTPGSPAGLRWEAPTRRRPQSGTVESALSLNFGDVSSGPGASPARAGWDASGVVVKEAEDGPARRSAAGAHLRLCGCPGRACARSRETWPGAERGDLRGRRAPVAGVTALRRCARAARCSATGAGHRGRPAAWGVRGAAGRAGRCARRRQRPPGRGAGRAGAVEVVADLDGLAPVDAVWRTWARHTGRRVARLAVGGTLQSVGWTSGEPACCGLRQSAGEVAGVLQAGPGSRDLATCWNWSERRLRVDWAGAVVEPVRRRSQNCSGPVRGQSGAGSRLSAVLCSLGENDQNAHPHRRGRVAGCG